MKCKNCGFEEITEMKKFTHAMSEYVYANGKPAGIFNTEDKEITIQPKGAKEQTKLVRKDVYDKAQAAKLAPKVVEIAKVTEKVVETTPTAPVAATPKTP